MTCSYAILAATSGTKRGSYRLNRILSGSEAASMSMISRDHGTSAFRAIRTPISEFTRRHGDCPNATHAQPLLKLADKLGSWYLRVPRN